MKWIYNIIDGISEQEDIIYRDDKFLLIPNFTSSRLIKSNNSNVLSNAEKFHLLAIIIQKDIKSLRDLTAEHINLLQHILKNSLSTIKKIYNINEKHLKIYIHYPPSTWHLHIHFCTVANIYASSSVEHSYALNQIIFNLNMCSDYYKKIDMEVYV